MRHYEIELTADGDTWLVTCPSLPEVTSFGETREDALARAADAIEEALAARIADGVEIPPVLQQRSVELLEVALDVHQLCFDRDEALVEVFGNGHHSVACSVARVTMSGTVDSGKQQESS